MLPINKKLTPYNFTDANNTGRIKYIVIHYVGAVSTAYNNVVYYARKYWGASAHYFVDQTSIWQCVEDADIAWHCGTETGVYYSPCRNSNSIGIEMCVKKTSSGRWYFEPETVQNTIELTRYLMKKYNVPIDRVIRHYDVTHKTCPEPYVRDWNAWQDFKNRVKNGDELTMAQYEEIMKRIDGIENRLGKVEGMTVNKMIYAWVDKNMPEWAHQPITDLMNKGILKGDEGGKLNLDDDDLRMATLIDRVDVGMRELLTSLRQELEQKGVL